MADVIRLVCPECDAVHRVKSVTLGKLYRCKKCRSGLITMQPAILQCPNCGATTPPTHIEASRLITCEECEKAPLMEVRLPGIEYPKAMTSEEGEDIASKMAVSNNEVDTDTVSEVEVVEYADNQQVTTSHGDIEEVIEIRNDEQSASEEDEKEELDENRIFKADTNFIVKGRGNKEDGAVANTKDHSSATEEVRVHDTPPPQDLDHQQDIEQEEFVTDVFDDPEEVMPDIEVIAKEESEVSAQEDEVHIEPSAYSGDIRIEENSTVQSNVAQQKKGWGWSLPAWVPAVLALLLIGLYGMLYADLDSMRSQLERSQEGIIKQDQSFQEERKKYILLIKSSQDENRKLRSQVLDLKSENDVLRKKSITFDIPELKDE